VLAGLAGRIAAILDSGACAVGVESTVLDLTESVPRLLRPGGTTREAIEAVIGPCASGPSGSALRSPGMLTSHYAPLLPVRLSAISVSAEEGLLAFGEPLPGAGAVFNLSEAGDVTLAATNLFAGLHWLDAAGARLGLKGIAVMDIPRHGLGLAITDRLTRAAADRAG
jgi:L-threonylcarbamoyladenylate synthase